MSKVRTSVCHQYRFLLSFKSDFDVSFKTDSNSKRSSVSAAGQSLAEQRQGFWITPQKCVFCVNYKGHVHIY